MTAEIGLMKATEQLSSLSMLGVDPVQRVVAPRLWAGIVSMPLLALVFSSLGIWGGHLVGVDWLGVDAGTYWGNMQAAVDFRVDVLNGLIKAFVFGVFVTWITVYQGMDLIPTADQPSHNENRGVRIFGVRADFFDRNDVWRLLMNNRAIEAGVTCLWRSVWPPYHWPSASAAWIFLSPATNIRSKLALAVLPGSNPPKSPVPG